MSLSDTTARTIARVAELKVPGYGDDEVGFMADTLRLYRPSHVFEWGTNRGSSARIWFEAAQLLELDCVVHTFELPIWLAYLSPEHPGVDWAQQIRDVPAVQAHRGDGGFAAVSLCLEIGATRPLFFVDGDHSFEAVRRELTMIGRAVPHAVIVLHDTNHPASHGPTGPAQAVTEYLLERSHAITVEVLESQAGMTRLWPR
jgi:hypothetical protein